MKENGIYMSSFELVYSQEKRKYVKRKIKGDNNGLDRLEGTEITREVTDEMMRPYIFSSYFRIIEFDQKILRKELPLSRRNRDISVDVYIDFMEEYLNRLRHGRVPDKSYILAAPDGFGKKIFAYQVIKEALAHKLTPTQIIPSHDLYTLLDEKKYTEFYQTFTDVDLAIVTFGGAPSQTDLIVIKTALEHCERHDVPLLILSRFEPEIFHRRDAMATQYLGVSVARKGNFGQAELKGFNREKMQDIRDELKGEGNTAKAAESFTDEKRNFRRSRN